MLQKVMKQGRNGRYGDVWISAHDYFILFSQTLGISIIVALVQSQEWFKL